MTHTNSIEEILANLPAYKINYDDFTVKEHLALYPELKTATQALQALIDKQVIEARQADFEKNLEIMKELWQENFMYRTLSGEYKHPDGDVKRMFVEYQELEPERTKFAEYVETRITELKKKGEK